MDIKQLDEVIVPKKDLVYFKDCLLEIVFQVIGENQEKQIDKLRRLYKRLGFYSEDRELIKSKKWWERARAVQEDKDHQRDRC
ncbi:MAG: hypothetical protein R6U44_02375 [Archaeoglobaceae archaeon]